ncbi:hypothetical protein LTR56_002621 [Elasticomyces elasticus]|nr:hypothetical protein LTR56_002621 [Elasticomyces elasticus]KAK5762385.1 hypothetical protein LTS12_007544 [Elasticomyces elasticus]
MADMFYFRSPRKANTTPRRSPTTRTKASITKRRRPGNMETFNPHACMARFDEPTFCPSNVSAILARYSLPFSGSAGSGSQTVPELLDDDDGIEDEPGGVPLTPHHAESYSTQDVATGGVSLDPIECLEGSSMSRAGMSAVTHSDPESPDGVGHEVQLDVTTPPRNFMMPFGASMPRSVLGSSHPRPESQELWDEEDGRRLRFALEGFDISEVPRFLVPNEMDVARTQNVVTQSSATHESNDIFHETGLISLLPLALPGMPPQSPQHDAQQSQPNTFRTDPANRYVDMPMVLDDDGLAVDDPRRNYDFADFLDDWRLRSTLDKRLIPFEHGLQPSIQSWRPPDHVPRDSLAPRLWDMQGIRWDLLGPRRKDALTARGQLCRHSPSSPAAFDVLSTPAATTEEEKAYRFRSFTPMHVAKTTHYQLRSALAATSRSDVFYSTGDKVLRTSLASPTLQHTIMDLSKPTNLSAGFRVTCLTASQSRADRNYVMAGGFNGEYAMLNLDAEDAELQEGFVTHAYNGLVTHIHTFDARRSGMPQAAFCANDHKVRLMDIGTTRYTNEFTYPHAINCAVTSPDGRLRALAGDSREVYITDAERGDTLVKLRGHLDHGFACAWSPNGNHVATGAQDGLTMVWDARNWSEPLHSLTSIMSCPRSLHFADDGALIVAESDDVVSVYDGGTFTKRQDIRFFGSIVGVALLDGGAELVVANADKTVGGLLTFQRTTHGLNGGTFGQQVPLHGNNLRQTVRHRGHSKIMNSVYN